MRVTSSSSSVSRRSRSVLCCTRSRLRCSDSGGSGFPVAAHAEQALDREHQGGDGRAKLVRRDREEVVAQPHRPLGLAQQAGVVDGQGGPAANLGRQLQVGRPEPSGRRGREAQGAQRGVARDERHDDDAAGAEPLDQLGVVLVDGVARARPRRSTSESSSGCAAREHGRRRRGRAGARRVALRQLAQQRLLARDRGARPARRTVRSPSDEVDDRPVGERPNAEAGERAEDPLVVEGRRHDRGRLAEQAGPALGRLRLDAAGALAFEEERVFQGDRGLRGQQLERQQALGGEGAGDEVVLEVEERDDLRLPADGQAEHRAGTGARQVRVAGEPAGVGGRVVEEHALLGALHVLEQRLGERRRRRPPTEAAALSSEPTSAATSRRPSRASRTSGAARAALLEDEAQERAQQLLPDHHAGDGLRRLDHREQVELLGLQRDGRRRARAACGSTSCGFRRSRSRTLPSAPQRR